jgi:hypothetical protein
MKNFDSSGTPILTDKARASFLTFVELCTFDYLGNGIRNLILRYLQQEEDREVWFELFLEEVVCFYDFIDDLGEEYSGC